MRARAPYLEDLLARLDPGGVLSCACGRPHRIAAGDVIVESDALARSAALLRRRHGATPTVWVLSDENTEAAAGERWKGMVGGAIRSRVLPATPKPVPSLELAAELAGDAKRAAPVLVVGVGGGVISDLVKKVSLDLGLPGWCIATAPSVDAYSSATASLRVARYHDSIPARASEVIVCDLEVLGRAPRVLVLAGLGDLLAKFVAYLDWNAARLVTGEHFCPTVADLALGAARKAIDAARELETDPTAAAASLTDAILVSGFAMQAMGNSRPAASAEHTIAHFWETTHAAGNHAYELHGILVGAATRLVLAGYQAFYRRLPDIEPDVARRSIQHASEPSWDARLEDAMQPFREKIANETRGRALDGAALAGRLEAFSREKARLVSLAEPLLAELSRAVALLDVLGFPFSLDEL
ncbi:MAG TPA: iron-containing alcohol dehydrogenase, partial [Candidatus Acidoferrum sp.]|nr:iron-containing alcohol dehydrogenase [Candidatus Acidoferrum sp.]